MASIGKGEAESTVANDREGKGGAAPENSRLCSDGRVRLSLAYMMHA